jgi:hypothetical protein
MKLSLLAELYQSVGRTFELVSERRPFNDILHHYADLADDTLALIRDPRSATLYPGSRLFSSVQFRLAEHPYQPGGVVTFVQFGVRPHALVLRDLMKVFGHWHAASSAAAAQPIARFDAFRVCNKSRFLLCAEFAGPRGAPQMGDTPLRVFFILREAAQSAEVDFAPAAALTDVARGQSAA